MNKAQAVLDRAAEVIEDRGWRQGEHSWHWDHHNDPVCAAEAINIASVELDWRSVAGFAMEEVKKRTGANGVAQWNDRPTTTEREVIRILRNESLTEGFPSV